MLRNWVIESATRMARTAQLGRRRGRKRRAPANSFRPTLTHLEERCLLAGNLPWPISPPAGQNLALYDTYGQYVGAGGLHFHEGIDIIAAADTPVTAVEKGDIRFIRFAPAAQPQLCVVVEICGDHGWNYIHTVPGINPRTGLTWAVGDQVNQGDQLGVVSPFQAGATFPTHLHLDYTSAAIDPTFAGVNLLTPIDDALNYLKALDVNAKPTVSDIHFRLAADDINGMITPIAGNPNYFNETPSQTHHYFTDTVSGRTILGARAQASAPDGTVVAGSPNIDIIADTYDQFQPGGNRLGVKSVWFSITGFTFGDTSGAINPYRFDGQFLPGQNTGVFRNSNLVRTVFENDAYSTSTTDKDFWYTLTNSTVTAATVGNPQVNANDRDLYWKSDVLEGNAWNATTADVALDNALAAFHDDFYTVDVWAFDAYGNMGRAKTIVLLDNFTRTISTSVAEYSTIEPIIVTTGEEYTANQKVPIYFLTAPPKDGQALARADLEGTATTNNIGELQRTNLDSAVHRGLLAGNYWVVADYLGNGQYDAKLDAFTPIKIVPQVTPTPAVTNVTPNQGAGAGGTVVTITGSNFTGATRVLFGSNAATNVNVDSATQITATAPAGKPGVQVDVTVTTPQGTSATGNADLFSYQNGTPAVTAIDPNWQVWSPRTMVTITGSNFTGATRVQFGINAANSFTVRSNTQITASVPEGQAGSTVDVRVITPWGISEVSDADWFTYRSNPPTVIRVAPAEGTRFGGTVVTITGTGLFTATDVRFGTNAATTFTVVAGVGGTVITATAPPGVPGTVDVTVTTSRGTSAVVHRRPGHPKDPDDRFTYLRTPAVTFVSPQGGLPAGGNVVTITGSNFVAAATVRFGAVAVPAANVTFVNATTLMVTVPALPATTQPPATVHITVTTASGTSPTSTADQYTYAMVPAVTAVAPNQGPSAGGTTVTITGTNFTNATAVRFGGVAAAAFTVDSPTQITVTSPLHIAGVAHITVTTPSGTSPEVAADRFTYLAPAPGIGGLNPNHGGAAGGTSVVITGANFTGATSVTFGSIPALAFFVDSPTEIMATSPPEPAGPVDITVTTASGSSSHTSADLFTFDAPIATSTLLIASPNASVFGQPVTFTATVTLLNPGAGTPTGTVQFQVDGANFGTPVPLTAGGAASTSISTLCAGPHSIVAIYSGDGNFVTSRGTLTQTVNPAPLTITANNQSKVYGAALPALTANYSGFVNGDSAASLSTPPTLTTTATANSPVGSYPITASGAVDPNYAITYVAGSLAVNPASTITAIAANNPTSVFGEPIYFAAAVVAVAPGAGTPTGTVAFRRLFSDGTSVTFGTAPLDASGTAIFVMDHFVPATATLFAVYQGDGNFTTSTSATITHVINPASTTLALSSSSPVSIVGQAVNFTATVSVVPPGSFVVAPTGTITLFDTFAGTTTTLVTVTLGGPPVNFPAFTTVGTHVITALYSGDSYFNGSTSPAINQITVAGSSPPPGGGGSAAKGPGLSKVVPASGMRTGPSLGRNGGESELEFLEALALFRSIGRRSTQAMDAYFAGLFRLVHRDATNLGFVDFEPFLE